MTGLFIVYDKDSADIRLSTCSFLYALLVLLYRCEFVGRLIPFRISKWSEFAYEKSLRTRHELQLTSYSNYKIHNNVISDFNKQ